MYVFHWMLINFKTLPLSCFVIIKVGIIVNFLFFVWVVPIFFYIFFYLYGNGHGLASRSGDKSVYLTIFRSAQLGI